MEDQLSLFDRIEEPRDLPAPERRDLGISRVLGASPPGEVVKIDDAILRLARTGAPFSADDVREIAGDPTRPNLLGARIRNAAQLGLIETCGRENSRRRLRHASTIWLWRGIDSLVESRKAGEMAKVRTPELETMQKIVTLLEPFNRDQRYRMVMYVIDVTGLSKPPEPKTEDGKDVEAPKIAEPTPALPSPTPDTAQG